MMVGEREVTESLGWSDPWKQVSRAKTEGSITAEGVESGQDEILQTTVSSHSQPRRPLEYTVAAPGHCACVVSLLPLLTHV